MVKKGHANAILGLWISILLFALLCTSSDISAEESGTTFEGTIQGLNCTYYNMECPTEDLDIYAALENDFVLVMGEGNFFLLPNLSPLVKARHLAEKVRITGRLDGTSIWVENLEIKENGSYRSIWNQKKHEVRSKIPMK